MTDLPNVYLFQLFATFLAPVALGFVANIALAALLWILGTKVIRSVTKPVGDNPEAAQQARATSDQIIGAWRLVVTFVFVAGILSMGFFGSTGAWLIGALALALALGSRSLLSDVFAGAAIRTEGQFKVGDRVRLIGPDVEGKVEAISYRVTVIREGSGNIVYVPNSSIDAVRNLKGGGAQRSDTESDGRGGRRTRSRRRGGRGSGGDDRGGRSGGRSESGRDASDDDSSSDSGGRSSRGESRGGDSRGGDSRGGDSDGGSSRGGGSRGGSDSRGSDSRSDESKPSDAAPAAEASGDSGSGGGSRSSGRSSGGRSGGGRSGGGRSSSPRDEGSRSDDLPKSTSSPEVLPETPWSIE